MTMLSQINAAGGTVANYIEDVFSTYAYTGTGADQTITNGIDLSTKGGLVWSKIRSAAGWHALADTVRGATKILYTNSTSAQSTLAQSVKLFNSTGYGIGSTYEVNNSGSTLVSWTFRKQPKFFDVVTYTGTGAAQSISHSLGSVPGCIIVKRTDSTDDWFVYHRTMGNTKGILLNGAGTEYADIFYWNNTSPTSTNFTVGYGPSASGGTYVAYIFAHNAGGFGLTGSDNVISCDYGTAASGTSQINVTLGYEPQWIMMKNVTAGGDWWIWDPMRGIGSFDVALTLFPNNSNSENTFGGSSYPMNITSTGFSINTGYLTWGSPSDKFIYVAIRKGPMKVPTDATKVFSPISSSATTGTQLTTGFPVDSQIIGFPPGGVSFSQTVSDRLRGVSTNTTASGNVLGTATTAAEGALGSVTQYWSNTGFQFPPYFSGASSVFWSFRRAPSFFDQVCFTGDGTLTPINHNLTVVPQLVITKKRSSSGSWYASQYLTAATYGLFNTTDGFSSQGTSYPVTATTFVPSSNTAGYTHVSYLFASCPGVSKVGSYTGTGTSQQIDCGFTAGSRFVLIKRMDSAGDWYVWDSARGIVAGNDPYLLLNSTSAEVTSTDYIDTYAAGFELSSTAPAGLNASGGTYLFLAIA